jgi:hypothetical protein
MPDDCPDKDKIELAARRIVQQLFGGNALAAAVAVAAMSASKEPRSKGGKTGAKSRQAKSATSKERVLELAKTIRGGNPTLAQTELAITIAEKNDPKVAVGYNRILTFLSELEGEGHLPRAQRRRNT